MATIDKEIYFYIFSSAMNFFCNITERSFHTGQGNTYKIFFPPYDAIVSKVDQTIVACNGTLAREPSLLPTDAQKEAMIPSLFYGEHSGGLYPLQIDVAKEFLGSKFIKCFNDTIGSWARHEVDSVNRGEFATLGTIVGLFAGLLILGCLFYVLRRSQFFSSNHSLFCCTQRTNSQSDNKEENSKLFKL